MYARDVPGSVTGTDVRTGPRCDNGAVRAVNPAELTRRTADRLLRADGPAPQLSAAAWRFDVALGTAMTLLAVGSAWNYARNFRSIAVSPGYLPVIVRPGPTDVIPYLILALVASVPLVWRRRYPLTVFWLVVAADLSIAGNLGRLGFVYAIIAAYSAVVYSPFRTAALGSMLVGAALVSGVLNSALPNIPNWAGAFVVLIPIMIGGNAIRRWKRRADESVRRMQVMELEAEEATRRAVESERSRIARELHDVVTHNVSVMVVQAGAARKVMGSSPEQATEALLAVEASGRAAMAELRQVMGLLTARTDGRGPDRTDAAANDLDQADLAPQPGLDQLGALVGRVRDTGVPVTLTVTGNPRPLPPGIGLAAYRTVQEALTNTVKHAVGASAEIIVGYEPQALRLEIADSGGTAGPSAATGNGRGLIGLRERLAVYGGSLDAGRRPTGGFRVRAVIPLAGMAGGPQDFVGSATQPEAR
jgi:signal transduction histidine kinase